MGHPRAGWGTREQDGAPAFAGIGLARPAKFIKRLQFLCLFRANLIVTRFALMAGI
jgi:hypothetical protein